MKPIRHAFSTTDTNSSQRYDKLAGVPWRHTLATIFASLLFFTAFGHAANSTSAEVWIGIRTDGQAGSGTEVDPFDGSTQTKYDGLMNKFSPYTEIHLLPGTFKTRGIQVKEGQKVYGSGEGLTILQLAGVQPSHYDLVHFWNNGVSSPAHNVEIHDLTCDGNFAGLTGTPMGAVGGIQLNGNNILIQNVELIHCFGFDNGKTAYEQFSIIIGGANAQNVDSNDRIINCYAHSYSIPISNSQDYTGGFSLQWCNNGQISHCFVDGPCHGYGLGTGDTGCQLNSSVAIHVNTGFYIDTGSSSNTLIAHNYFACAQACLSFYNNINNPFTHIRVDGNNFTSSGFYPGSSGTCFDLAIPPGAGSAFTITNNDFIYTGTGPCGFIGNSGHVDLYVSGNTTNCPLERGAGDVVNAADYVVANSYVTGTPAYQIPLPPSAGNGVDFSGTSFSWYRVIVNSDAVLTTQPFWFWLEGQSDSIATQNNGCFLYVSLDASGKAFARILGNRCFGSAGNAIDQIRLGTIANSSNYVIDVHFTGIDPELSVGGDLIDTTPADAEFVSNPTTAGYSFETISLTRGSTF